MGLLGRLSDIPKCLNRAEFVVVGWSEPEGRRPYLGSLLLGYYDPDGRLIYAGRVGSGIGNAELERVTYGSGSAWG